MTRSGDVCFLSVVKGKTATLQPRCVAWLELTVPGNCCFLWFRWLYHLSRFGIVNHEFFIAVLFLYVEIQLFGLMIPTWMQYRIPPFCIYLGLLLLIYFFEELVLLCGNLFKKNYLDLDAIHKKNHISSPLFISEKLFLNRQLLFFFKWCPQILKAGVLMLIPS